MKKQNLIKRKLAQPDVQEHIRAQLGVNDGINRTQLADELCDRYGFVDGRGHRQRSSCLKALRSLEKEGSVVLPAAQVLRKGLWSPRRLGHEVPGAVGVPEKAGEIQGLELKLVEEEEQMRIWNELMIREHPQGQRPMVGRQVRYLVGSEHGWLGAVGFGAAAFWLEARDRWIGWDRQHHDDHLDKVVCMNRLLIRNQIRCRNLASKVLGMAQRGIGDDFQHRYGYRPWLLESFVDTAHYRGSCYKAANWTYVGQSQGRGRQNTANEACESIKDIYLYPLVEDFRERMGVAPEAGEVALGLEDPVDGSSWASREFGGAELGDRRLSKRLVTMAEAKAEHPGLSWPQVFEGDRARTDAYYRFIAAEEDSEVQISSILAPHRDCTIRRMKGQNRLLCVMDASDLDYSDLRRCEGLGVIGKNQTTTSSKGLELFSTFVLNMQGLPLGVLRAQCTAPQLTPERKGKDRRYIPAEDKDTYKWIEGFRDIREVSRCLPGTKLCAVADRESDFFEFFDEWRQDPSVDLVVRAKHDRKACQAEDMGLEQSSLFEDLRATPAHDRVELHVPRRREKAPKGKKPGRRALPARKAAVALSYKEVWIRPPTHGLNSKKDPVKLWALHLLEEHPPQGEDPIEWFLLTTIEVDCMQTALECIQWYRLRWRIEDWHRVLKSGCRIEQYTNQTAQRLRRAIAIDLVVAWRIMLMTLMGRELPDLPADILFTELEIKVLKQYAIKKTQGAGNSRRDGRLSRSTRRSSRSEQRSGSGTPSDMQRLSKTSRLLRGC